MNRYIRNELLLIIICSAAAFFGPVIWINAKVNAGFLLAGLVYSIACLIISSLVSVFDVLILERINDNTRWLWGTAFGLIPFFVLVLGRGDFRVLLEFHRTAAFLNMPVVLLLLIILVIYLNTRGLTFRWSVYKSGLGFIFPFFLILLLVPRIPNSEGKVLIGNIGIIYFFLKTLLNNQANGQQD